MHHYSKVPRHLPYPPPIFTGVKNCNCWPYCSTMLDFEPLWFGTEQDIATIFCVAIT